jgi:hypothetical protein
VLSSHCRTYGSKNIVILNLNSPLQSPSNKKKSRTSHAKKIITHSVTKALYIPIKVLVRLYNAKISWIGTSGVGPFMDDSNSRFWDFCKSVIKLGTTTATNSDTRSNFLQLMDNQVSP